MNLILGNCLDELKNLPDKSVDMFYLDLPFGQTACSWDKKVDLKALWVQLKRLAKSDRTGFFFSTTTKFGFELFNNAPKGYFRWDLVWEKNRAAGFLSAYKLPLRKHEMIYVFSKKSPVYDVSSHTKTATKQSIKAPSPCEQYGQKRSDIRTTHKDKLPTSVLPEQDDIPDSWCKYAVDGKTKHGTSKPIPLMEFLLKYWSKEGDVICDPTMGSGSMGVACKKMGRNFIGIEMSEEFYELAKERIDEATPTK